MLLLGAHHVASCAKETWPCCALGKSVLLGMCVGSVDILVIDEEGNVQVARTFRRLPKSQWLATPSCS